MKTIKAITVDGVLHPETPFPATMTSATCNGEHYIIYEGDENITPQAVEKQKSIPAVFIESPAEEIVSAVVEDTSVAPSNPSIWQKIKGLFS
jgi:hypothetical protein